MVSDEFKAVMAASENQRGSEATASWDSLWQRASAEQIDDQAFAAAGFEPVQPVLEALRGFLGSPILRAASVRSRERIDRIMPALLKAAARSSATTRRIASPGLGVCRQRLARGAGHCPSPVA